MLTMLDSTSTCLTLAHLAGESQLKAIAQRAHIRVRILHQLKRIRDDLDRPRIKTCVLPSLEAEREVAGMLLVEAEGVDGALGVGFGVGCQPAFYELLVFGVFEERGIGWGMRKAYQCRPLCPSGISRAASSRRPS